jgi:hypothetical protein
MLVRVPLMVSALIYHRIERLDIDGNFAFVVEVGAFFQTDRV